MPPFTSIDGGRKENEPTANRQIDSLTSELVNDLNRAVCHLFQRDFDANGAAQIAFFRAFLLVTRDVGLAFWFSVAAQTGLPIK
jgi:hypothetical protein